MTLECETRRPAKHVSWLKGTVELRSGKKYVIKQKGAVLSLTITFLEKSDADLYTCDVGTMQSRAHLTVQGKCVVQDKMFRTIKLKILRKNLQLKEYCTFSIKLSYYLYLAATTVSVCFLKQLINFLKGQSKPMGLQA